MPRKLRTSFVEHPSAILFLLISRGGLFQQPLPIARGISLLEPGAPYELAGGLTLYPAYLRGQANLLAHNGIAAAGEFQKLLDHKSIVQNFVTGSLAHIQIGRSCALAGDKVNAKAAYQRFFSLWRDADPDVPILREAQAE